MTWRKMMIQRELKVRRFMKRRGNVENSEEFTDLRPNATDAQVLRAGHWGVAGFAIFMAAFVTMLHGVKIDLGFV